MTNSRLYLVLATFVVLALPTVVAAEDGGWNMPNLNPFARRSGPPTSSGFGGGGGMKMPNLWPRKAAAPAGQPAAPSTWQRMQTNTRSFWSKTADVLNPFDDANDNQQEAAPMTGRNSAFRQATMSKGQDQKSKSFLPSWNWGQEEKKEQKPQTVQDFLALPRPGY